MRPTYRQLLLLTESKSNRELVVGKSTSPPYRSSAIKYLLPSPTAIDSYSPPLSLSLHIKKPKTNFQTSSVTQKWVHLLPKPLLPRRWVHLLRRSTELSLSRRRWFTTLRQEKATLTTSSPSPPPPTVLSSSSTSTNPKPPPIVSQSPVQTRSHSTRSLLTQSSTRGSLWTA